MKRTGVFIAMMLWVCALMAQMVTPVTVKTELEKGDGGEARMVFRMKIDEGWHVYGTKKLENGPTPTSLNVEGRDGVELLGELEYEGDLQKKYDEVFELDVEFFEKEVTFVQRLKLTKADYHLYGNLEYAACNDQSCLPPTREDFEIGQEPASTMKVQDQESSLNREDAGGSASLLMLLLWGFLGGLIALTTPCVWPIIPMTVSFFLKKGGGVRDAMVYGLSIIIIYVGLGLIVTGLFGANALNSLATNAVFNVFFAVLLLVFGLSMAGLFEITLPASWTTSVDSKASATTGFLSIFLMAFTLALVSFSCTGPIIGFLLVELATDGGNVFAPAVGMLGFSIGLALPFTLFAMFPGWLKSMPKSGSWMETVKRVLGVIEIAFALKFFSVADLAYGWGLLSRRLFFIIWIVLFAGLGIYLIWEIVRKKNGRPVFYVLHTVVAAAALSLAAYMVPGLWGAPCKLVGAFAPPKELTGEEIEKHNIFMDYYIARNYACDDNMPMFVDFSGYGCVNCRKMEAAVLSDSMITDIIYNNYIYVKLYVDDRTKAQEGFAEVVELPNGKMKKLDTLGELWSHLQATKFGANSQPFYVLVDCNDNLLAEPYAYDEDVEKFAAWLKKGLKTFKNK